MRGRRTLTSLLAAALLALPPMAAAADRPEIEYAYPDQSVWTAQVDENGLPANPLLRLAKALFAEAGIPWHGAVYPASRMFLRLRAGDAQFSMLVQAPALKECCLVSRLPVAHTEVKAFWIGDKPAIRAKEDLAGRSVILIHGYSYGTLAPLLADSAIERTTVTSHRAAFNMLEMSRGDYLLDYSGPAAEMLAARPIANLHSATLADVDVHLVLHRSYPDAETVMARLEAIADKLDKERILRGE